MFIRTPEHQPLSEFYITLPELPSHQEVMQSVPASAPDSNGERRTAPLWARVCLWVGGTFSVASGAFFIVRGILS